MIPYQRLAPFLQVLLVIAGAGLVARGLWLAWPPLGWVAAGAFCLCAEMGVGDRIRSRSR